MSNRNVPLREAPPLRPRIEEWERHMKAERTLRSAAGAGVLHEAERYGSRPTVPFSGTRNSRLSRQWRQRGCSYECQTNLSQQLSLLFVG